MVENNFWVKDNTGNNLLRINDVYSFKSFDDFELERAFKKHVSCGEFDNWLRKQDLIELADKLKIVETRNNDSYLRAIEIWAEHQKIKKNDYLCTVGYEKQKAFLEHEMELWLKKNEISENYAPEGVLLYGPPGCGKTALAINLCKKNGAMTINKNSSDIIRVSWSAVSTLKSLFGVARAFKPTALILDEVELLGPSRNKDAPGEKNYTVVLLSEMDGLENNQNVLIIGLTNYPWQMDQALLRSGRFSNRIFIGPPENNERKLLFEKYLAGFEVKGMSVNSLVKKTHLYSCADVKQVCLQAIRQAHREKEGVGKIVVRKRDFLFALNKTKSTILPWLDHFGSEYMPDYAKEYFPELFEFIKTQYPPKKRDEIQ